MCIRDSCDGVRLLNTNSSSELFEQMIRIGEEDVITVSYTHLDVYKRQALAQQKRALKLCQKLLKNNSKQGTIILGRNWFY